jgi:hypothetical protein
MKKTLLFSLLLTIICIETYAQGAYTISASSFLGDTSATEKVTGTVIQSDGTIIIAANMGSTRPGNINPLLLNGATAKSNGAILRLSADGKKVLAVTLLAAKVLDLTLDNTDNIYVAAGTDGVIKLNPTATTVTWKNQAGTYIHRVDVASDGYCAVLAPTNTTDPDGAGGNGKIYFYDPTGKEVKNFAGYNNSHDLCIDPVSKTIVLLGWRQAHTYSDPVQIAYIRGYDYTGAIKWTTYDWSADSASARYINRSENNMADTRGYRCCIGGDGKLYCAFECAGGNHIFRYSPHNIMTKVPVVGGDKYFDFYNTKSEHKTFFGRYNPANGDHLLGQQLLCRLTTGTGNALRVKGGAIKADETGRVFIGGSAAWGLPLTFNPFFANAYQGGSWMMVISADFKKRLYCTRLSPGGETNAIDARVIKKGSEPNIVWGGIVGMGTNPDSSLYTINSIQPKTGGGKNDAFFGVINPLSTALPQIENEEEEVLLYPNPAAEAFTIRYESPSSQKVKVVISNLFSQVISEAEYNLVPGANQMHIATGEMQNGLYFVTVISPASRVVTKVQLVK